MNDYAWAGQFPAPLAVVVGVLICFWGYRILKLTLGILGLFVGAAGGWTGALSIVPGHNGVALACAVVGGILGAILCVWLFYLGIFLLGASAGVVMAAAGFAGVGHPAQPIYLLAFAIVFGLLALVLQKFMIIVSTAFSGSYLITAGLLHLVTLRHEVTPLWFDRPQPGWAGVVSYVALAFWIVCGLVGARFQYHHKRSKEQVPVPGTPPAR